MKWVRKVSESMGRSRNRASASLIAATTATWSSTRVPFQSHTTCRPMPVSVGRAPRSGRGARRAEDDVAELGGHLHDQLQVGPGLRGGQLGGGAGAGSQLGEPGRRADQDGVGVGGAAL